MIPLPLRTGRRTAANVFTVEADSVLQYVSAMTGDLDTAVTASVYLLNEDATLPDDGVLLDSVTETFRYAGYHRLDLNGAEDHNSSAGQYAPKVSRYAKGIVNPGESFVSFESGKWTDWADAIAAFGNTGCNLPGRRLSAA